jgi:ribonuclease HII
MVIAGVIIDKKLEKKLKALGVKDSKELSPKRREELAKAIEEIATNIIVFRVQPCKIDDYRAKGINLDKIEAMKIAEIISMSNGDKIYVDSLSQNSKKFKELILSFLDKKDFNLVVENYLDESVPVVSAASIIAKVERDKAIEEIKRKVNFDFASLAYEGKILVENEKGQRKLIEIGKLVEENLNKNKKNYIFGVNPKTLKIEKFEITGYIKHPEKRIFTLSLDHGKKISLSLDHPLFVLGKDGNLEKKEVKDVIDGECVAAPLYVPSSNSLEYLNLAKLLVDFSTNTQPIYLEGNIVEDVMSQVDFKIRKISKILGYKRNTFYNWLRKGFLPLHLFKHLDKIYLSDKYLFDATIRTIEPTKLPAIFKLNKDFAWFLGLYVAKGYIYSPYHIAISNTDKKIIERLEKIGRKLRIETTKYPTSIVFNSILLVKLVKALKIGGDAYNKKVPEFIFSSKVEIIREFLNGYFEGDGYFRKGNLRASETRSRELAEQLQWLLLFTRNYTSYSNSKTRNRHVIYELSKEQASNSVDNIPIIVGKIVKNLRKGSNITLSKLSKISKVRLETINRIENQKSKVVTKKVLKRILIALKKLKCNTNKLDKIVNSDLCWIKVNKIEDTKRIEPVYDLEVKPNGKKIENFICNGILVHNSGYSHDPKTIAFVEKLIKESKGKELPPYVRKSWVTTQILQEKSWQRKIKDFILRKKEKCKEGESES